MTITAIVRALVAAGATPEMILAAVEAAEGFPKQIKRPKDVKEAIRTPPLQAHIIDFCCSRFGVTEASLRSSARAGELVEARQVTCWMLHRAGAGSLTHIGRMLNRDHTTVLHSIRKVEDAIKNGGALGKLALDCEGAFLFVAQAGGVH